MAYQKTVLKLEMKDIVLVKPSKSTPCSILSLSTIDNMPVNDDLFQTVRVYQSTTIHDSSLQPDPAHVMKEALAKALFYYYPLAGRIVKDEVDGKLRVKVNCDCAAEYGVPFLEATANCDLSSLHYLDVTTDTEIAKNLVLDLPSRDKSCYQYPMVMMVTKFQCGGFTIGMGFSHAVCDGSGVSQVFHAIVELARGISSEPSVKPVWERERLVGSIITKQQPLQMQSQLEKLIASAAASPFLPTTVIKQCCFKVEGETIRRLKSLLKEESTKGMKEITTFESLAAYVWRSRARALKLSYDGKTMLTVLVGVRRKLLDYPLPDGYYGNATVEANVVLTVRELNERPLSEIVKLIKETKNIAFTTDYIRNTINTLETKHTLERKHTLETKQEDIINVVGSGALTVLTEWKHLGFMQNVDFGGREAVNMIPSPSNTFGSVAECIFSSPNKFHVPSMKGGVRIFTYLPIAAIPKFREEIEALSFL